MQIIYALSFEHQIYQKWLTLMMKECHGWAKSDKNPLKIWLPSFCHTQWWQGLKWFVAPRIRQCASSYTLVYTCKHQNWLSLVVCLLEEFRLLQILLATVTTVLQVQIIAFDVGSDI